MTNQIVNTNELVKAILLATRLLERRFTCPTQLEFPAPADSTRRSKPSDLRASNMFPARTT
jgi:hypothetical protein